MKKLLSIYCLLALVGGMSAQVLSNASYLRARAKSDVVVPFRYTDEGVATPIEWGLDLAWLSEENIRRGVNFAGRDLIDIVRTSYTATESVEEGALSDAQVSKIRTRANIIKKYLKSGVAMNINHDHGDKPAIAEWYNANSAGAQGRGQRWATLIDLSIKKYAELGLTNFVSISPYNEPDYGWGQGYSKSTRMSDFLNIAKELKNGFDGAYANVRICGGNTLNDDLALEWWNYLKNYLDEGNTHQLAGSFDNYANFFQTVREYGHHATADELHNTMEAMVGVEYGMQTGIWWGTCEHSRSQFMKATDKNHPGKRLAYAEHRPNWTAAAVYRLADGRVQAFGGTSERQAASTGYTFVSTDRPVWFDGLPGRDYVLMLPGGTGYQQGQTNAETVIDVQGGDDVMPHIDGTYKVVNMNSGHLMGFSASPNGWTSVSQKKNSNTAKLLQWVVKPLDSRSVGDYSYYTFTLNTTAGIQLDILDWNMNAGADVGGYQGGLGTNEQWFLEYAGHGAFYIRSRFSAKYLGVKGGSKSVSANIEMQDFTGEASQQWRFLPASVTPDFVAPDAPASLTAVAQASSVRLTWEPSTSNDVAGYTILRSTDGNDFCTLARGIAATEFTDNEALDGVSYIYKVCAQDRSLNVSEPSTEAVATATGQPDCVCHLPFDFTLNDTTANGNHCAVYGDTIWAEGYDGEGALSLNGTDNFVQLPYTVASHDELTIACRVYWAGGNNWQRIWDFGSGTDNYLFLSPKCGSGMRFAIKNGGAEQQMTYSKNLTMNTWVHVVVTIGPEGAALYLDGKAVARNTKVDIQPSQLAPVLNYIGRSQFPADPYFNGRIDDFKIYNRALSADEVAALNDGTDGVSASTLRPATDAPTYDLSGRPLRRGAKGIAIQHGRKTLR